MWDLNSHEAVIRGEPNRMKTLSYGKYTKEEMDRRMCEWYDANPDARLAEILTEFRRLKEEG